MELSNFTYDELEIGQSASITKEITLSDIQGFAAISGDINPAHLDSEYAAKTMFKEVIAHGMLNGAYISAVLGTKLPGLGTIYLSQELSFMKPVKIGTVLEVVLTVKEKLPKNRVVIECNCFNQDEELVCTGTAKVLAPAQKLSATSKVPEFTLKI
ncbi:MAG: MaoC/PaaZ C-terminal domain-containing protein [Burkholderiales bacterium]|nr:MaoC/PaaZ C-terminal domain-containing protein [Burkholderiales bacterium]